MFTCPVCYYTAMQYPPMDYNICECCGTEFGLDDDGVSHDELRALWVRSGAHWFFGDPPRGWNASRQLYKAFVSSLLPPRNETAYISAPPLVVPAASEKRWNSVNELALAS